MSSQELKVIITAIDNTKQALQSAQQSFSSLTSSITATAVKFSLIYYAAERAFGQVSSSIKSAMQPVEDFSLSVTKMAAMITSMQTTGDLATNYAQAKEYAAALVTKLEEIDQKTLAGAQDLSLMTEEMAKQGLFLDLNNQKQIDGFTNLANAVAVISAGSANREIQIRQEIGALLRGQLDMHSQLGKQLDAMVGGSLKQKLELWKKEGTVIEHIGGLLQGYAAASDDIQNSWAALGSTMETIKNRILREGFGEAYRDINEQIKKSNDWLKDHSKIISEKLNQAWTEVKFTLKGIEESYERLGVGSLGSGIGLVADTIAKGFAYTAYVILPALADNIKDIAKRFESIGEAALNVGKIIYNAIFKLDWEGAKAAWADLKKNISDLWAPNNDKSIYESMKKRAAELEDALDKTVKPKVEKIWQGVFDAMMLTGTPQQRQMIEQAYHKWAVKQSGAPNVSPISPSPEDAADADKKAQDIISKRLTLQAQAMEQSKTQYRDEQTFINEMLGARITAFASANQEIAQDDLYMSEWTQKEKEKLQDEWDKMEEERIKSVQQYHKQFAQADVKTFSKGWHSGLKRYVEDTGAMFNLAVDMARQTAQAMQSAFQTFFFDMFQGKITTMKQLLTGLANFAAQVASNILASLATTKILSMVASAGMSSTTPQTGQLGDFGIGDSTILGKAVKGGNSASANEKITVNIIDSGNKEKPDVSYSRSDLEGLIIDVVYRNFQSNGGMRHLGAT